MDGVIIGEEMIDEVIEEDAVDIDQKIIELFTKRLDMPLKDIAKELNIPYPRLRAHLNKMQHNGELPYMRICGKIKAGETRRLVKI